MIRQSFDVEYYWRVIVFYNMDYNLLYYAVKELMQGGFPKDYVREVLCTMYSDAKAVTCSNTSRKVSVIIFNPHPTPSDYIDSIVHEAEHVKQAMLYAYDVEDKGEPPAYTIGYLISRMYTVFKNIICNNCL